jgi:hypothetical protein
MIAMVHRAKEDWSGGYMEMSRISMAGLRGGEGDPVAALLRTRKE